MLDFGVRPCIHGVNVVPRLEDDFAASGGILDGFEPGRGTASLIPPGIRKQENLLGTTRMSHLSLRGSADSGQTYTAGGVNAGMHPGH
jgi:hypothetical protein